MSIPNPQSLWTYSFVVVGSWSPWSKIEANVVEDAGRRSSDDLGRGIVVGHYLEPLRFVSAQDLATRKDRCGIHYVGHMK